MRRAALALSVVAGAATLVAASAAGPDRAAGAAGLTAPRHAQIDPGLARRLAASGPERTIQAIVVLRRQAPLAARPRARRATRLAGIVRALKRTARAAQAPVLRLLRQRRAEGRVSRVVPLWIIDGFLVAAKRDVLQELAARPDVQELRPNSTIHAPATPAADPSPEANISLVNAPALWNAGHRGQGVVVANMDTGVDVSHPELSATWRGGPNSWFDPNNEHPTMPTDVSGHGTWTMGVMVGGSAGGTAIGVAPAATWIAVKIFNDHGAATTAGIHQGFQWLLDPDGNPSTADAPNVVNDSWVMGSGGCSLEFQPDLQALRNAGIVPVFAAGNTGPSPGANSSPANNPEALAVGGTDNSDAIDPSSSRGPSACGGGLFPDLVAPDTGIRTTDLYGLYSTQTGTSLAAPHVAGVLALLLSAFPGLSADRQETALESAAVDLGATGPDDTFGHGRLDALAAYNWLAAATDFTLAASPPSVTTAAGGAAAYTVSVAPLNGFSSDVSLSLSGLTASQASWSFTPSTITGGSGGSQLSVTTSPSLPPGTYPLTISGTGNGITHQASVALVVPAPPDFTVGMSPSSAGTTPGGAVTYTVSVGALHGFSGSVALSLGGLTAGQASWSFTPPTITGGAGRSQLLITTSGSTPPGNHPLTVIGTSGGLTHATGAMLVVTPLPDFSLEVTPASAGVSPGGTASYTVSITGIGGFSGGVTLSARGLPSGASASFSPNPVVPESTSTLKIRTARYSTRGTFTITVTGKSGTHVHQATTRLVVGASRVLRAKKRRAFLAPRRPSRPRARAPAHAAALW